ncbi:NADH-quinone oxidoreductase subunit N [Actinoplanes lutulentus]|uniref:NADH-quinone oxidoreductase subunit N n=1 Tax=Actinoplanes lutulentus TaxID=1287878 RepID=A0A327ZIH1_9ACTN|nr:NADH-quinone oxidoreductase subunit N [Actinoplanes lutulentus]MBB2945321.1 NADH-quinone oxidoreductase subunit N [Actinoplanes lutulentus]RAK40544.1 NADH dehydrogenase subunit N [Actinoplanes lutulentus]
MSSQSVGHFALLPLYAAAGTAILALLADLFTGRRAAITGVTLLGTLATAVCAVLAANAEPTFCATGGCSWIPTGAAATTAVLFAGLTAGVLAFSLPALRIGTAPAGEFCFLLACSMTGGVTVAYAGDLITLIVGLETLTLPLYVLVGLRRFAPTERVTSDPAAASLTFFLISVVSTAIALLGVALNYVATGVVHLASLGPAQASVFAPIAGVGAALLVIGLAFKVAAVPLHAWAPATYDGAPVPVAAYLSTASKLGGILALVTVVSRLETRAVVTILAILTMTIGNLVALRQTRMVRLLAWSSVAQAGYILAALAIGEPGAVAALAYAGFFVVLELVAFGVVVALRPQGGDGGTLADFRGAGRRSPWLGAALILAFAGLAGLPPGLAGLFAKLSVVDALIDANWTWLAGVVVLNAVIALAYYVRVSAALYTLPPRVGFSVADPVLLDEAIHPHLPVPRPVAIAVAAAVTAAVALGFAPQLLLNALT